MNFLTSGCPVKPSYLYNWKRGVASSQRSRGSVERERRMMLLVLVFPCVPEVVTA